MINVVIETGAKETMKPEDHGCADVVFRIYGHLWEIIYMDEKASKKR
jgi:predicted lactoylglutathione lyase